MEEIPNAAAINEAVEIAKSYESQDVVAFINGILGTFVRAEFADTPPKPEKAAKAEDQAEDCNGGPGAGYQRWHLRGGRV